MADALATGAHYLRQFTLELGSSLPSHISTLARSDSSGLPYLRYRCS